MKVECLKEAKEEAIRFLKKVEKLENAVEGKEIYIRDGKYNSYSASKHCSAIKRSSMDLTRSLSELRNNNW